MSDRFSRLFRAPEGAQLPPFNASFARGSMSEEVANQIMALIKAGYLKANDRLPTEQQMTLALGISRPPLREALKALTLMGVLESRQGGRYTVTDLSPSRLVAPFNMMLSVRDYDASVHYEARAAVDLECVRLCATRARPEVKARLLKLAEDGPSFLEDPVGFRVLDAEFHGAIYAGAGNVFLEAVAYGLYDVALELRRVATLLPGVITESCEDHRRIASAIALSEPGDAVSAYRAHLDNIRDTTIRSLAEIGARPSPPDEPAPTT